MIRMMFLIFIMSMLLASAAKAGTSFPALLLMGSLIVLAVLILLTRSQPEE